VIVVVLIIVTIRIIIFSSSVHRCPVFISLKMYFFISIFSLFHLNFSDLNQFSNLFSFSNISISFSLIVKITHLTLHRFVLLLHFPFSFEFALCLLLFRDLLLFLVLFSSSFFLYSFT